MRRSERRGEGRPRRPISHARGAPTSRQDGPPLARTARADAALAAPRWSRQKSA